MKELAKEHIYITHGHRQQCGDGLMEGGGGLNGGGQRNGGTSDICNSVNNKSKVREKKRKKMV